MPVRLAIFDFDGTLVDSFPWFLSHLNRLAEKHRFRKVEPHELESVRALGSRALLRHLGVPLVKLPVIAREMRALVARDGRKFRVFPGIEAAFRELAASGIRPAIVTSNSEENVRAILGPELCALVEHFGCGASLFGKARLLKRALKATGLPAAEAVYIGDEARDLEAATRAGLAFGFVRWGFAREAALGERPRYVFETPEEIAKKLSLADGSSRSSSG